jgi:integrase
VSEIDAYFMDRFRKRRTELLSKRPGRDGQNTATKDMVTIREIVNYALELKLIHEDPLAGYSIKKAKSKPQPYWVQDELDRILAAARRQPHQDVYRLLGWTGMRIGEVENLTWNDIDLDNRVIRSKRKRAGSRRPATRARCRCPPRSSSCWVASRGIAHGSLRSRLTATAPSARFANAGSLIT